MSHKSIFEMLRFTSGGWCCVFGCIVVLCISSRLMLLAQCTPLADSRESNNAWSFRIGNLDLFNIPAFGRSLFGVTEGYGNGKGNGNGGGGVGGAIGLNVLNRSPTEAGHTLDPDIIEDSFLDPYGLIEKYGYPAERHQVTTEDGYILELHRIARNGSTPVLLFHGLLDSSATWVMMGPNKGLAYYLYEAGYDVWMNNARGNKYSINHTHYSRKHAVYWDFSFHEIGKYDLPAVIDYVLNQTSREQLHYIGHSQGTTTFWILCSERPEYTEKIILMQALAPVAYVKHCKSPIVNFMAFYQDPLSFLLRMIGAHEFLPNNEFITMINEMFCDEDKFTREVCSNVIFLLTGFDQSQMNETMLPVALGHAPAGASTKQIIHFGQLKHSGHFRQYDFGWLKNMWRYGSHLPPTYKLSNVRNKVALHYSQNDWLAQPEDVEHLHLQLPNVIGKFLVPFPDFNHLDFVWAVDARNLLYKRMLKLMKLVEKDEL